MTRFITKPATLSAAAVIVTWALACVAPAEEGAKPIITCSTTQIADFARQIVGDRCEVRCVLAPGQDPHTFEVTPDSVALVRTADLCLDNGWHLEGADWMRTLANQEGKPITSCTEDLQPLMLKQGGEEKAVKDPHAWFSPINAARYVTNVHRAVVRLDPDHELEYDARAELYLSQLRALHNWTTKQINRVPPAQRVLVTSHDAFNYFCDVYGFKSSAPVGWSTQEVGAEMTPASRKKVIDSIRTAGVPSIFVETSVNPEMIQEIAKEAGVRVGATLYSDSMGPAGSAGETYIGMMRENVLAIVRALTVESSAE